MWGALRARLLAYFRPRVSDAAAAEDLVQEVLLRVHRQQDALAGVENVGAWVQRVARNALTDHYRRRASAAGARDRYEAEPAPIDEPEEPHALAACLRPLLDGLPDPYAEAVRLVELEGLTQRDAAARVGLSLSGMKSRVQRGRDRLKDALLACCDVEVDARNRVTEVAARKGPACC
jgi:RNA polymerase sigma-70 factor (ECF subfamily)